MTRIYKITNKEIIETTDLYYKLQKEEEWYLKQSLEKQIPQQVILTKLDGERCPKCGNDVGSPKAVYYCHKCGQRLKY